MAKNAFNGINGVSRKVKQPFAGVSEVARKVKNGYVGVDGVARQFFGSGIPINTLAVGSSVYLNVNGVSKEFLVVHQGLPSSMYDSSCDGIWLLMKDAYESRKWSSSNTNDYKSSDIHAYLNGSFFNLFDAGIQAVIKQVKIPYHNGNGNSGSDLSGANGLSTKIFLLGGYEVSISEDKYILLPNDGACLDYFKGLTNSATSKRVAYLNGTAVNWWLRSSDNNVSYCAMRIGTDGRPSNGYAVGNTYGVRPALILPSTVLVDSNFNVIA